MKKQTAVTRRRAPGRDELASVLRHEVNNPLTGVLGNAELILVEEKGLSEKSAERLQTIVQLALRLRDVARRLEEELRGAAARPAPTRFEAPPPDFLAEDEEEKEKVR
jgi:signal transduction histidine kinase